MTSCILALAVVTALTTPSSSQHSADTLTMAQMHTDFDILRGALEEAHGGLYRFSTKEALDHHFDTSRARIDHPMTRVEFIGLVSETLAAIRDGHTRLEYDEITNLAMARARLFPLRVALEEKRLVVTFNDTPNDSAIRPGMEVIRINGQSVDEIVALILPKLPGDGFIETGKRRRLGGYFAQLYWLFVDQASEFTVTARHSTGQVITATLVGVQNIDRDKSTNPVNEVMATNLAQLNGPDDRVSLQFIDDPAIARLRIRAFGGEEFPASIEAAFRTLRDKDTQVLILDLRGNGGGVDEYGAMLVSQFTDRPFRYFDRIHVTTIDPSFTTWVPRTYANLRAHTVPDPTGGFLVTRRLHPGVDEQQGASSPFLGKLFVLMDGGTFSTAADVTAQLRHLKLATFIGEETGGTYEGNTSGLNALVKLPNSTLSLKVMMYGYWNAVDSDESGRGTLPDYLVQQRVADVLIGIDAPLARAIALGRGALNDAQN